MNNNSAHETYSAKSAESARQKFKERHSDTATREKCEQTEAEG